jgi:hypothetical protein
MLMVCPWTVRDADSNCSFLVIGFAKPIIFGLYLVSYWMGWERLGEIVVATTLSIRYVK